MSSLKKPLDLIELSIDEEVFIKCRGNRQLRGKLHAFDQHLNMVLSDVEETTMSPETNETWKRRKELLFVRGDIIILVSPPLRT